jgi:hypothetical protein
MSALALFVRFYNGSAGAPGLGTPEKAGADVALTELADARLRLVGFVLNGLIARCRHTAEFFVAKGAHPVGFSTVHYTECVADVA